MRVFIAIKIPSDPSLMPPLNKLRNSGGMRVYDSRTLHLTLKFVGETDEERIPEIIEAVNEAAEGIKPFPVRLKGLGSFPGRGLPKIVWIGVTSGGELEKLAGRISDGLKARKIPFDRKKFVPHVTVARARGPSGSAKSSETVTEFRDSPFFSFVCNDVTVFKSELGEKGAVHTVLHETYL